MALLWMDGFDHYGVGSSVGRDNMLNGIYSTVASGANGCYPTSEMSRTGGRSLRMTSTGNTSTVVLWRRIFGEAYQTTGYGCAIYFPQIWANISRLRMAWLDSGAGIQCTISFTSTGAVTVWRGNASVLLAQSADGVIVATAWQHIEAKVKVHGDDGAVEVRVNGVTVVSVSGVDTRGMSEDSASQFAFVEVNFWNSGPLYIDDIYMWSDEGDINNDFIGDKRVGLIIPNDDTAQSDWTPVGSGTGFGAISEIPQDADATYIETQDVGHVSEFELQDVVGDIGAISAVQTYVIQRKTVAGVCNTQVGLISDSAETLGADRPITEQYTYYADVFETDPNTAAPWTKTGLSAARLKIERAA